MKMNISLITGLLAFGFSVMTVDQQAFCQNDNGYIGSKTCGMCHPGESKAWVNHSHAKMLRQIVKGAAPDNAAVQPPEGKSWNDLSYIVGGACYYARFIDAKGYVITGPKAQWSMVGKTLTPFKPQTPSGSMKYDCIKCHVTGFKESGTYKNGVQNALEGIPGAWYENGICCETCHGMGKEHFALKNKGDVKKAIGDLKIKIDKSMEACGVCHKRVPGKISVVAKDLVESRQQYTEMQLNRKGKSKMACISCHSPHISALTKDGMVTNCESCHSKVELKIRSMAGAGVTCLDCHMPFAARGAYDSMVKSYHRGDTRSHILGISVDPAYVLDDGAGHASLNDKGLARLTVEMTCFSCHKAGKAPDLSRAKLLSAAAHMHK
ncbi:MAG: multiheme c-type cytochrome [Candidatus Latescibacterota bacterium]